MRGLKLNGKKTYNRFIRSHLLQMRGLKRDYIIPATGARVVASFTDAWIETEAEAKSILVTMSHLLQMRGLKRLPSTMDARTLKSHLLQMRGLKRQQ